MDHCWGMGSVIVGHGLGYPAACGIFVPRSGVRPPSPAWEGGVSATGASRTSPSVRFLISPGISLPRRRSPASYGISVLWCCPASCLRSLGTVCVDDSGYNNPPLLSFHPCPWVHSGLLPLPVPSSESSAQPVLTLQKLMKPNRKSFMDLPDDLGGLVLSQPTSQLEGEASGCDG